MTSIRYAFHEDVERETTQRRDPASGAIVAVVLAAVAVLALAGEPASGSLAADQAPAAVVATAAGADGQPAG